MNEYFTVKNFLLLGGITALGFAVFFSGGKIRFLELAGGLSLLVAHFLKDSPSVK